MARCHKVLVLLIFAACGSDSPVTPVGMPDAKSALCATSADCTIGHWCNPKPVDSNPADTICEPRGSTLSFDGDIYPTLMSQCAGCHVAGVADSQGGTITVFAGGPDVAFASLTGAGVDCRTSAHKICVNEPKSSTTVVRLLTHLNAQNAAGSKLIPMGYADAFLQKYLHWIAAGATRNGTTPDAPLFVFDAPIGHPPDAPIATRPDATLPDATLPDAPGRPDAPFKPDALIPPPGAPVITSPNPGGFTPSGTIPVTWLAAAPNGSAITRYDIHARRVSDGMPNDVACNAPFNSPCMVNGDGSLGFTFTGLDNCTTYDVSVTATNANGSTESTVVNDVQPRALPNVPTGLGVSQTGSPGVLSVTWNASNGNGCGSVSYGVEITPPGDTSCGNGNGVACTTTTTDTSFGLTAPAGVCPYPSVNCANRRFWSFRVRATNAAGNSAFAGPASGSPKVGFNNDNLINIFQRQDQNFCFGCHVAGGFACGNGTTQVLGLDTDVSTVFNNLRNVSGVVIPGDAGDSLLHLCPTQSPGCNTRDCGSSHPGGHVFDVGSLDDNAISAWINDGAVF